MTELIDSINLPLSKFLTITECPPQWKHFNLYLIRDEQVVFYVGQSQCAYERVWDHLKGGIKGHAIVGRFVLCNWPKSARFRVELHYSRAPRFAKQYYNLDAAEQTMIEAYCPCFNVTYNSQPAALPAGYEPPNAAIKYLKSFRRMMREARVVSKMPEKSDLEW